MGDNTEHMKNYWNGRFVREGAIWGEMPSRSAEYALELFQRNSVRRILVPGAGYGRNTRLFSSGGFEVVGIEISDEAFRIAEKFDEKTKFYNGSVFDMPHDDGYDALYCFNLLHLFLGSERMLLLSRCREKLREGGFAFFVVFSELEESFGKGKELEHNTFESKPGRAAHYFTESDLLEHFRDFRSIETGIIEDTENHGEEGFHRHMLRYIFCQKE
jgi:SAM-dependent methyltransferase